MVVKNMNVNTEKKKLLLLGFGDIAKRLLDQLDNSYDVTGVRRQAENYPNVNVLQGNCGDEASMLKITKSHYDFIVITMTPSEMSDHGYQQAYVKTTQVLLESLRCNNSSPELIVFVSSSSVYGQSGDEWIDENSETLPNSYSGKRLLEAESLLMQSDINSCVVRFSGIYGPGRQRLIEQVIAGKGAEKTPVLYSNRIHSDDCAGVLHHIISRYRETKKVEPLYLATDCEPSPLYDVQTWLAQQLNVTNGKPESKSVGRSLRSSKRCSNKILLDSGYTFLYPTFREGYKMVLDNMKDK